VGDMPERMAGMCVPDPLLGPTAGMISTIRTRSRWCRAGPEAATHPSPPLLNLAVILSSAPRMTVQISMKFRGLQDGERQPLCRNITSWRGAQRPQGNPNKDSEGGSLF
jgi:hypothetical protein